MEITDHKYDLTNEEYNRCLLMAEMATFIRSERVEEPRSIFVVAQAGAGKTGLKNFLINEAQDQGKLPSYTEFNPDEIAIYHKYYREILQEFPDTSYKILQRFVQPALDTYLRQRAVELRNNLVQEGTFGSSESYIKILEFQKNGGVAQLGKVQEDGTREQRHVTGNYKIDINVLAVDRFESLLSCYEREQYFRENGLPPRVVTPQNHDYAYEKQLETLRMIEQKGLFDSMRVFKRGYLIERPELVYVNGDKRYPSAVSAVIAERNRNRSDLLRNPETYFSRIQSLRERVERDGIPEQLERIGMLETQFREELSRQEER